MKGIDIIKQGYEILECPQSPAQTIERAGRTCYKTEGKITSESANDFAGMLIRREHNAMIEFADIQVVFRTDRGVSHELVRHRHCSFAQESTRYVTYKDHPIKIIKPVWCHDEILGHHEFNDGIPGTVADKIWYDAMWRSWEDYSRLLKNGWPAQKARTVLNNSLKTDIVVKANVREIRHILDLRCSPKAHPQMVALMTPLLVELHGKIPVLFDDIYDKYVGK